MRRRGALELRKRGVIAHKTSAMDLAVPIFTKRTVQSQGPLSVNGRALIFEWRVGCSNRLNKGRGKWRAGKTEEIRGKQKFPKFPFEIQCYSAF